MPTKARCMARLEQMEQSSDVVTPGFREMRIEDPRSEGGERRRAERFEESISTSRVKRRTATAAELLDRSVALRRAQDVLPKAFVQRAAAGYETILARQSAVRRASGLADIADIWDILAYLQIPFDHFDAAELELTACWVCSAAGIENRAQSLRDDDDDDDRVESSSSRRPAGRRRGAKKGGPSKTSQKKKVTHSFIDAMSLDDFLLLCCEYPPLLEAARGITAPRDYWGQGEALAKRLMRGT